MFLSKSTSFQQLILSNGERTGVLGPAHLHLSLTCYPRAEAGGVGVAVSLPLGKNPTAVTELLLWAQHPGEYSSMWHNGAYILIGKMAVRHRQKKATNKQKQLSGKLYGRGCRTETVGGQRNKTTKGKSREEVEPETISEKARQDLNRQEIEGRTGGKGKYVRD